MTYGVSAAMTNHGRRSALWRDAAIWALFAALLLEFGMNTFNRQTLWHRVTSLEQRIDHLERLRSR